jgi:rRNA maturation endonuclease Nob1
VLMDGIQKQWKWVLKCRGCAAVSEVDPHSTSSRSTRRTSRSSTSSSSSERNPSPCPDCGSARRLVRLT